MRRITAPIVTLGLAMNRTITFIGGWAILIRDTAASTPHLVMAQRGRNLAWGNLWFQMSRVGLKSLGVVGLVCFCIGAILAMQISPILATYGATSKLPSVIGIAMFRELGPLLGAIVLTGFAGASIAAELGTMAVGEEIRALRAHAISPVRFLVVPRVTATVVMTAALSVWCNVIGVAGGMFTCKLLLGIDPGAYLHQTIEAIKLFDFLTGFFKAAVFGLTIGSLACFLGINVRGGAQGVGQATTRTVVFSIIGLTIIDLAFTAVFYTFGL